MSVIIYLVEFIESRRSDRCKRVRITLRKYLSTIQPPLLMSSKTIAYKGSALNKQHLNMAIENMELLQHVVPPIAPSPLQKIRTLQRVLFLFANRTKPQRRLYFSKPHNCCFHESCTFILFAVYFI